MEKPKKKTLSQMWDDEILRIRKFKNKGMEEGILYTAKIPKKPEQISQKDIDELRQITPDTVKTVRYRSADAIDLYTPSNTALLETRGSSSSGTVVAGVGIRYGHSPTKSDEEKEFTALRYKLKMRIEAAEERGYVFDDTTKELTDSVYSESDLSRLREILDKQHPEKLYRTAYKVDEKGEYTQGITAYNRERAKGLLQYQSEQIPLTHEEKEFTALRNRLKVRVEGAEKRGYIFDDVIKELIEGDYSDSGLYQLREILDKQHPENLYRTAYKVDEQGEYTSGIKAYKLERAKSLLEYHKNKIALAVDRMDYVFEEAFKHGGTLAPLIRNQLRMATQELGKEKLYVHLYRLGEEFIGFMTWLITYEAKNVGSLFRSYAYLSSAIKGDKHPSEVHDFENTADEFYTFINSPEYQDYLAELEGVEDEQ